MPCRTDMHKMIQGYFDKENERARLDHARRYNALAEAEQAYLSDPERVQRDHDRRARERAELVAELDSAFASRGKQPDE